MFGGFPFGLMFLNFVGMVLFFIVIVVAVKFIVRGARGYGGRGRGGPWGSRWYGDSRHGGGGGWGYQDDSRFDWAGGGHPGKHGRHGGHGGAGRGHPDHGRHGHRDEALDVVRERLARGEIDTGEYQRLSAGLTAAGHQSASGDGQGSQPGRHGGRRRDRALGIARLRFASGELTLEDFQSIRSALEA